MCRSRYHKHQDSEHPKSPQETRSSFYSHLFVYLMVNTFLYYNNSGSDGWKFVAIFWGMSLLSHYKRSKWALGAPELSKAKAQSEEYVDDIEQPAPKPNWKDRDLV